MKTIHQRLQSRISRRRNTIRAVEQDIAVMTQRREEFEAAGFNMSEPYHTAKEAVSVMAADQKLDKELYFVLNGVARHWSSGL